MNSGWVYMDNNGYRVRQWDPDPFTMASMGVGMYEGQLVKSSADCEVDIIHPEITLTAKFPTSAKVGSIANLEFTVTNTGDVPVYKTWFYVRPPIRYAEHIGYMAPGDSRVFYLKFLVPNYRKDEIREWSGVRAIREIASEPISSGFGKEVWADKFIRIRIIR